MGLHDNSISFVSGRAPYFSGVMYSLCAHIGYMADQAKGHLPFWDTTHGSQHSMLSKNSTMIVLFLDSYDFILIASACLGHHIH